MIRIAFPTDEHFPFQNDRAREVALKIVQDFDPDILPAGSDGLDFYKLSHFDRDPARMKAHTLQEEIHMWQRAQLEWKSAAPRARRQYIMGNHEFRWDKALWKMDAFYEIADLSLANVLGLKKLGIEPEIRDKIDLGEIVIRHGQVVRQHYQIIVRPGAAFRINCQVRVIKAARLVTWRMIKTRFFLISGIICVMLTRSVSFIRHSVFTDILSLAILMIVAVAIVNPIGDIPLNDDWSYGQTVKTLMDEGVFRPAGWTRMALFSQAVWGALFSLPFGFSYNSLRISTLVLGLAGVITTYLLLGCLGAPRWVAWIGGLILAFNPIYFSLFTVTSN